MSGNRSAIRQLAPAFRAAVTAVALLASGGCGLAVYSSSRLQLCWSSGGAEGNATGSTIPKVTADIGRLQLLLTLTAGAVLGGAIAGIPRLMRNEKTGLRRHARRYIDISADRGIQGQNAGSYPDEAAVKRFITQSIRTTNKTSHQAAPTTWSAIRLADRVPISALSCVG